MSTRQARIPVSLDLLEHLLPAGSVIHGFTQNEFYRTIEVLVEHPSFDELHDGDNIPVRTVLGTKKFCEPGNHSYVVKVEYAS